MVDLLVALLLAFVARPAVVGLLSLPMRLRWGERLFVMWGGLRGAVPIMLGTLALLEGIDDGERVYDMIFIVVAFSVLVQGEHPVRSATLGPHARHRSRRRSQPRRGRRLVGGRTHAACPAAGRTHVGADRDQRRQPMPPRGDTVLEKGDEVELVLDVSDVERLDGFG